MLGNSVLKVHKNNLETVKKNFSRKQSRAIAAILYEEEIYIENIDIPKAKRKWIKRLVENNLTYNFEDIDKLAYSYEIINKRKGNKSARILCVNSDVNEFIQHSVKGMGVKAIYLIQFCYSYFAYLTCKADNFILIFNSGSYIYILFCEKRSIIKCEIMEINKADFGEINSTIQTMLKTEDIYTACDEMPLVLINFREDHIIEKLKTHYNLYSIVEKEESKIINKYCRQYIRKRHNFVSRYYIQERNLKNGKLYKIVVMLMLLLNVIVLQRYYFERKLLQDYKAKTVYNPIKASDSVNVKASKKFIDNYKDISSYVKGSIKIRKFQYEDNVIQLELEADHEEEDIQFVKDIEMKKRFTVFRISPIEKTENSFKMTVDLRVL